MAELANLVITVSAAAEQAEEALERLKALTGEVAEACERQLRLEVDASGAAQAQSLARGLAEGLDTVADALALLRRQTALNALKSLAAQLKTCGRDTDEYAGLLKRVRQEMDKAGLCATQAQDDLSGLDAAASQAASGLEGAAGQMNGALSSVVAWAMQAQQNLQISGTANVDVSPALSALGALVGAAMAALGWLAALGVETSGQSATRSYRSAGGGSARREAEDAARAAEQARKDALGWDYQLIEHKRHMNEITLEEELALLEAIRRNHRMTAEEIMDWEERVYDVRQDIRRRDEQNLDTLSDGVLTALENRYQAQLDQELDRLDQSRAAWETWRDETVAAIEAQIAALEKLSDAENREAQDAEELRKIAKLEQEIAFEQDAYNRMQLQQQLAQAVAEREQRLRRQALEDEKEALREQITQAQDKAQAGLDALDEEQTRIERAYEERLQAAALQAEAERVIMTQSQEEILQLLTEYAPAYNATGQTLGEKLAEGFQNAVGSIEAWFSTFNERLQAAQESLAQSALDAADAFSQSRSAQSTVIHQTVNFNQPVETPSQAARRVAQANEALADELAGAM